jgi:hypothetical protein
VLGAEDRLRHDLDERHTGAVVVDERVLGTLDAPGRAADVRQLAGILLHVGALDRHLEAGAVGEFDLDGALEGDRLVVLADLVVLREVRVEVVLAREPRRRGDLAAEREAEADRVMHRLLVDDRQRARQSETDGRDHGVRLTGATVGRGRVRCIREHLRLRVELDMHLEAEHRLEHLERLVEVHQFCLGHQTAPFCAAKSSPNARSGALLMSGCPHCPSSSASSAPPTV